MTDREKIDAGMKPLFEQAERDGLWFHCAYQDLWFSPAELRKAHSEGRFLWGAVNWTLKSPGEHIAQLEEAAKSALAYAERAKGRVAAGKGISA